MSSRAPPIGTTLNGTYTEGITFWTRGGTQNHQLSPKSIWSTAARKTTNVGIATSPTFACSRTPATLRGMTSPPTSWNACSYNVPRWHFGARFDETFQNILGFLQSANEQGKMGQFLCQNGVQAMFGTEPHQTSLESARNLLRRLTQLL